jgi:hypothetical protein
MDFTVIMAFSRLKHVPSVKQTFIDARKGFDGGFRVIPVCDTIEQVLCWQESPYEPILALKRPEWFAGHRLLNVALDQLIPLLNPMNHYVGTWTDDDAYEDGFFDALSKRITGAGNPQVAICSMRRWMHQAKPVDHLTADAAHMKVCSVGLEQVYVRSDIMQHYRYGNSPIADGFMVEQLYKECGKGFAFFPELVTNWNRFV